MVEWRHGLVDAWSSGGMVVIIYLKPVPPLCLRSTSKAHTSCVYLLVPTVLHLRADDKTRAGLDLDVYRVSTC